MELNNFAEFLLKLTKIFVIFITFIPLGYFLFDISNKSHGKPTESKEEAHCWRANRKMNQFGQGIQLNIQAEFSNWKAIWNLKIEKIMKKNTKFLNTHSDSTYFWIRDTHFNWIWIWSFPKTSFEFFKSKSWINWRLHLNLNLQNWKRQYECIWPRIGCEEKEKSDEEIWCHNSGQRHFNVGKMKDVGPFFTLFDHIVVDFTSNNAFGS